jgi:hypothetical protein
MNNDIFFGQNSFRFYYYRFKDSAYYPLSIVVVTIVVCVFLIFRVVIPQIGNWFSIQSEIAATSQRIDILKSNINYMNNLDRGQLASDLDTATRALPPAKDFGSILNAIAASAVKAGVSLDDYSFQVGSISTSSAAAKKNNTALKDGISTVQLSVNLSGAIGGVRDFLDEVEQKLPLAEVVGLEMDNKNAIVDIQFYQKDFPKIVFQDEQPLAALSDKHRALLQQLSGWQSASVGIEQGLNEQAASSGAVPLF